MGKNWFQRNPQFLQQTDWYPPTFSNHPATDPDLISLVLIELHFWHNSGIFIAPHVR